MVDSGATGNFVSYKALARLGLQSQLKQQGYLLRLIDGTEIRYSKVIYETRTTTMVLDEHEEQISFNITDIGTDEIILGIL